MLGVVKANTYGDGLSLQQSIDVIGVASQIAKIAGAIEREYARVELRRLREALESVWRELNERSPYIHASCFVEALLIRETHFTLARAGISMNGHCPSRETGMSWSMELQADNFGLQPALSWKTLGSEMHSVGRDESVEYGRTWAKRRLSELAVIPVGYADGYSVPLGNRGWALFRGRPASVVGRLCINILTADVIDIPEVSVAEEEVQVEELASLSDSINFEFLPLPSSAT